MYISTKTYEYAFPCCFRQWRAESHCRFLHGYALTVRVEFAAEYLDELNWVVDFGGLRTFKNWLTESFDHKLLVAKDDPEIELIRSLKSVQAADVIEVPNTGCEAFAHMIYVGAQTWLFDNGYDSRVHVHRVEVKEHSGNSAIYGNV